VSPAAQLAAETRLQGALRASPDRPLVMGVVNVTPDSFSDGGCYSDLVSALRQAERLIEAGASVIDIGGESTRPGARPTPAVEELRRVVPVIEALRRRTEAPISIDTMKPEVAKAAVEAGADIWNDVMGLGHDPAAAQMAATLGCELFIGHIQGEPQTMQAAPRYDDAPREVAADLSRRASRAEAAGVDRGRIWLDPGLGFGKTAAHNFQLLASLGEIVALGYPVLVGASRKGFIRTADARAERPDQRLGGSLAAAILAAQAGVRMIRVHDVAETVQALAVVAAVTAHG
jgi:dihydropteroate synthase